MSSVDIVVLGDPIHTAYVMCMDCGVYCDVYKSISNFITLCKSGKIGIQQAKQLGTDEIPKGNWCVFDALLDDGVITFG